MKLRNLLLTAALFLSTSVAFAGKAIDADLYDIGDFTFTAPGNTVSITLEKGNQSGFEYAVYDVASYDKISGTKKWKDVLATYSGKSLWLIKEGTNTITLPNANTELGVLCITKDVYSSNNPDDKWLFYRVKGTDYSVNSVSFGKPTDDNGHGNNDSAKVTFGAPLPTPVVTLLIALALGAGFVMYRNRKQQAEA